MANSPQSSDEVRCGMCGKLNPVNSAACKYCGARLRPMTPEELGLTPSQPTAPLRWPEERKRPEAPAEPPQDTPEDPLASLRFELSDADDATIIGPSASKDRIRRQDLFENVEPDFTVGKPSETPAEPEASAEDDDTAVPTDIPDWLRDASKTGDTGPLQTPSGQMPDWLMEETRASEPPKPLDAAEFDAPDWLGKPVEDDQNDVPDWMAGETARNQATRPMPAADDQTPDWMQNLDQPEQDAPTAGVPDWLIDETPSAPQAEAPSDDALEWLRSVPPPEPADEANLGIPDWLGEATSGKKEKPNLPAEDRLAWLEDKGDADQPRRALPQTAELGVPDWLHDRENEPPPAAPTMEPAPAADLGDVPDGLSEATQTPEAPQEESPAADFGVPDWLSEAAQPPVEAPMSAPTEDEPSEETPMGVPDWLKDAESAQEPLMSSGMPDWLAPASAPREDEASSEADWLRPPQDEVMEPEAQDEIETFETPDWLRPPREMEPVSQEETESVSEADSADEAAPEVPAWLSGLGLGAVDPSEEVPAAEIEDAEPEIEAGVPDWLSDLGGAPAVESAHETDADQEDEPALEIPDWMAGLGVQAVTTRSEVEEAPIMEAEDEESAPSEAAPEVPDWLSGLGGAPAMESAQETDADQEDEPALEIPDWMAGSGVEAVSTESEVEDAPMMEAEDEDSAPSEAAPEVPDWLAGLGGAPAAPVIEAESMEVAASSEPAPEVPDWLAGLGGAPAETPAAEPVASEVEAPSEAAPEVPDWLANLGGAPAATPAAEPVASEAEAPSEAAPEVPDWLANLGGAPATETPAAEPVASEAETFSEAAPEVPDWLANLGGTAAVETPAAEPVASEAAPEVPDWLSGLGGAPAEPAPAVSEETPDWLSGLGAEPAAPVPAASDDTPDWLSGLGGAPAEPAPAVSEETPNWLSGLGADAPAAAPMPVPAAADETPDWLSGIDTPAAGGVADDTPDWLSDAMGSSPAPAASPAMGDSPDWLADLDDLLGTPSEVPAGGEDLLGLQDFMQPTDEREDARDLDSGNLPSWLREVDPEDAHTPSVPSGPALDVPAELADLRFETITSQQSMEPTTEKVGALKDVTGVIRSEIIFDGRTLEVGKLSDELVVTDHQRKRIEALEGLLERQAKGVVVVESAAAFPIVRWLIALLILSVTLVAALMAAQEMTFLPTPISGADVDAVTNAVNALPANSNIVMVFEYDAETAAEMQPIAAAMLDHLASRGVTVYMISTRPTGPALAQQAMAEVTASDFTANWVNLGYLTGGAKGISALVTGNPLVTSPLASDYRGNATNLNAVRLSELDPKMLIIVASRWEDLRAWIEQTQGMQVKTIAATSLSSAPMAHPYTKSGQIEVVLSGVNDAVQYRAKNGSQVSNSTNAAWNGQALGGIVSALMIVGGSVVYGLRALRQQEQE